MCHWNEETVDHLLLHCPVAHSLWVYMFQIFGTQWVMPGFVERLVYCWSFWLGKFNSYIWNMVPSCLMWIVWTERNRRSFEDTEKSLVQLQALCQKTLFDWFRCWGFSECSTILEFISSLSIVLCLLFVLFVAFPCVHHHEHLVLAFFYFLVCFNNILFTYQKKKMWNVWRGRNRKTSKDVYLSIEGLQSQFVGSLFYWRSLDVS